MPTESFVLTYDSLVSTVPQYLERRDPSVLSQIPVAISMCEFDIAQKIKTLGQLQVATSAMQINNPVLPKPARWRKTVSLNVLDANGNRQPVLNRRYEYIKEYWPDVNKTGLPLYYADYDYEHWFFGPTPDVGYQMEVLYYERIEPLSSTNQTNWLTQNAPNAMLFGTLMQMMPFLKNDQRTVFNTMYMDALSNLKSEDTSRVADRQAVALDS